MTKESSLPETSHTSQEPGHGRTALFVSELMTEEIIGLPEDESAELLDFLFQHQRKPEFVYEHIWQVGDLLMWDNRCSVHARTDFPSDERRMLRRLTIQDFTGSNLETYINF